MTPKDLRTLTCAWAHERNINNPHTQALKLVEEVGETISELNHGREDSDAFEDGLGDIMVSLVILSAITGHDLFKCWEKAYTTIRDRKGRTVDGNFIKDE